MDASDSILSMSHTDNDILGISSFKQIKPRKMSWAEEQDWFGLEDLALYYEEKYDNAYNTPHLWVTQKGKILDIRKMETKHIRNCIRCIESHKITNKKLCDKIYTLRAELQKRLQ